MGIRRSRSEAAGKKARVRVQLAIDPDDPSLIYLDYCRSSYRPSCQDLIVRALELCYGPQAFQNDPSKTPDEISEKARLTVIRLECLIHEIRRTFNVEAPLVYPAIASPHYFPGSLESPSLVRTDSSAEVVALEGDPSKPGEDANDALMSFLGENAQIVHSEFPFSE